MQTTDEKTLGLIKDINKKKAEIAKLEKPNWKTNCSFSYSEGKLSDPINIHVESNIRNLVNIAGFLLMREAAHEEAIIKLDLDRQDFTWQGFSVNDWLSDIKTRIDKIRISSKRDKLDILEKRLNAIISPELRAELELQAIQDELK